MDKSLSKLWEMVKDGILACCRPWRRKEWDTTESTEQQQKEINPEYSFKPLMLKLQYFGHLMRRTDSLEKTLMLGKTEGRRRRG